MVEVQSFLLFRVVSVDAHIHTGTYHTLQFLCVSHDVLTARAHTNNIDPMTMSKMYIYPIYIFEQENEKSKEEKKSHYTKDAFCRWHEQKLCVLRNTAYSTSSCVLFLFLSRLVSSLIHIQSIIKRAAKQTKRNPYKGRKEKSQKIIFVKSRENFMADYTLIGYTFGIIKTLFNTFSLIRWPVGSETIQFSYFHWLFLFTCRLVSHTILFNFTCRSQCLQLACVEQFIKYSRV